VIELLSESDGAKAAKEKMSDWIVNGARLAWLVDPYRQQVLVFRPDREMEPIAGERIAGDGPLEGFVLDLTRVWKCYQD
jgi:Uma2 family endonuclease